jgi:hypothetical protein
MVMSWTHKWGLSLKCHKKNYYKIKSIKKLTKTINSGKCCDFIQRIMSHSFEKQTWRGTPIIIRIAYRQTRYKLKPPRARNSFTLWWITLLLGGSICRSRVEEGMDTWKRRGSLSTLLMEGEINLLHALVVTVNPVACTWQKTVNASENKETGILQRWKVRKMWQLISCDEVLTFRRRRNKSPKINF